MNPWQIANEALDFRAVHTILTTTHSYFIPNEFNKQTMCASDHSTNKCIVVANTQQFTVCVRPHSMRCSCCSLTVFVEFRSRNWNVNINLNANYLFWFCFFQFFCFNVRSRIILRRIYETWEHLCGLQSINVSSIDMKTIFIVFSSALPVSV